MKWKKFMIDYFDVNQDGVTNWWEYLIPIGIVLAIEIAAEFLAQWAIG